MAYNGVKHSKKKVNAARERIGRLYGFNVEVQVVRSTTNAGGFAAAACVQGRHGTRPRCSRMKDGHGSTPTAAAKKALHALARKLK